MSPVRTCIDPPFASGLLARFVIVMLLLTGLCVACSRASESAPPVYVCGRILYRGAIDIKPILLYSDTQKMARLAIGNEPLLVQVGSCDNGQTITINPPGVVRTVQKIMATDGRTVALRLVGVRQGKVVLRAGGADSELAITVFRPTRGH